jgi:predicted thioesterase
MDAIQLGMKGTMETTVSEKQTARHLGSGGVDVYATPAMIGLMEGAAVNAIDPHLDEGEQSVGVEVRIRHLAATPLGQTVRAEAEVTEIDRRRVTFSVRAWDEQELIGEGVHVRFVIDVERYAQRLKEKSGG